MAYSSIVKPSVYFNTKLYTGNSSTNNITGVGFQPDWVWMKNRGATDSHYLYDAVRGVTKSMYSNLTTTEDTKSNGLTAFGTDGFTLGNEGDINGNGNNFVSWNWKANGAGSANTDGTINSTVSVNTTAGFSIVKYVGTGANGATVGHGLGAVPKMIIIKTINNSAENWYVYHASLGNNKDLLLNLTNDATSTVNTWYNTTPTSTVWTMSNQSAVNSTDGNDHIAYCFAEKQGYSKFGSYAGNNNADGTFVYTGFSPAFIIIKKYSGTGGWQLRDNKRTVYGNETLNLNYANSSSVEQTTDGFDFLSNGFKWRNQASDCNGNGNYIYMAFAQNPLVANSGTDGVPATAR